MNSISKLWYHLTAYLPRRLPDTPQKYERMKRVLIHAFGLPDDAPVWALVSGQISSQHPHKLRMAWGNIANAAKRIGINNLAQDQRKAAMNELQARLSEATAKHSTLMAGVEKLFTDHPDIFKDVLAGDPDALDVLCDQAATLFPDQAASPEQWAAFIKNQAVQKNVADTQKGAQDGDQSTEKLKAHDADPGTSPGEPPKEASKASVPAQELRKRGGQARGSKGSA